MLAPTLIQKITIFALPLLFAITLHEVAHGWVAYLFGDYTAKLSGRITINPIKHIDPIGTVLVPLLLFFTSGFIFGWAKPVPVNAKNVKDQRIAMPIVSLAGPLSNLLMALFWGGVGLCGLLIYDSNSWLGEPLALMGRVGVSINILLGVLNCLPIPPLDGGHALYYLLPGKLGWAFGRIEPYGFIILVLLLASGLLNILIGPPCIWLISTITSLFGLSGVPSLIGF